ATAVKVCDPFRTPLVSHVSEYGALVRTPPRVVPSSRNWTRATAWSSPALAVTVIDPLTLEPSLGLVSETVGGVVSAGTTTLASFEGGPTLPAASSASTR